MPDKMQCPICGKEFDVQDYQVLDNGNPACPECADANIEKADT